MNFKRARRPGPAAVVDLTPLIDVVFLLLIFFAVSTTLVRQAQLRVTLPTADGAAGQAAAELEVRISAAGDYAVNGVALPDGASATLAGALAAAPDAKTVTVAADARARHEAVVRALEAANRAGLADVYIVTRPRPAADGR